MKILVKVKLKSRQPFVKKIDDTHFEVAVKEPPIEGRANQAIIQAFADYFDIAVSHVEILHGHSSRQKVIEICL
jgi:uncharacterized protein (TIGR00251 family)